MKGNDVDLSPVYSKLNDIETSIKQSINSVKKNRVDLKPINDELKSMREIMKGNSVDLAPMYAKLEDLMKKGNNTDLTPVKTSLDSLSDTIRNNNKSLNSIFTNLSDSIKRNKANLDPIYEKIDKLGTSINTNLEEMERKMDIFSQDMIKLKDTNGDLSKSYSELKIKIDSIPEKRAVTNNTLPFSPNMSNLPKRTIDMPFLPKLNGT